MTKTWARSPVSTNPLIIITILEPIQSEPKSTKQRRAPENPTPLRIAATQKSHKIKTKGLEFWANRTQKQLTSKQELMDEGGGELTDGSVNDGVQS